MIRLLVGLALLPTAGLTLWAAAGAVGGLARAPAAFPLLGGMGFAAAAWALGRYGLGSDAGPVAWAGRCARRAYVFGHELTHALAAWAMGEKVLGFKVGESGGHVDLSRSNAFIALAPYCVPLYALFVVAGFRLLAAVRPAAAHQQVFLVLLGAALAFHLLMTFEVLWDRTQPDLAAAGGAVFSLACIGLANGLFLLLLFKALFPSSVSLADGLATVRRGTVAFWSGAYRLAAPLTGELAARLR